MRPAKQKKAFRILVVEDHADFAAMIENSLKKGAFEVSLVGNGADGLAALATFRPHLILLDFHLPDMDGIGFLNAMKNQKDSTPVFIISGHIDNTVAERAALAGAADYLVKPFHGKNLVSHIGNFLRDRNRSRSSSAAH